MLGSATAVFRAPSGGLIAIAAAPGKSNIYTGAGVVLTYTQNLFNFSRWDNSTTLLAPDPVGNDGFGFAITASYDTIAATTPYKSLNGTSSGVIYLFGQNVGGLNMWGLKREITPSDAAADY